MWPVILVAIGLSVLAVAFVWWRKRRTASKNRLISFVALLKKPQTLEPIYVATAARKAWNADLGDGTNEGEDGFVVGAALTHVVRFRNRMFLVNSFPIPYVENPQAAAEEMTDLRLRALFAQHTAWISCDAMEVGPKESSESVCEWYRLLGSLLAELIDDNCLAILLPDPCHLFAYSPATLDRLKADDPVAALLHEAEVPVVEIPPDSKEMERAVSEARQRWPEFVEAFEKQAGKHFAAKAPITRGDQTEFIWITVTALENNVIYGELANEPMNLPGLTLGSTVKAPVRDLNDWGFVNLQDEFVGGFTIQVVEKQRHQRRKKT